MSDPSHANVWTHAAGFRRGRLFTKEALARLPIDTPFDIEQDMSETLKAGGPFLAVDAFAEAISPIGDLIVYLYERAKELDNAALGFAPESFYHVADYNAGFHQGFCEVTFVRGSPSLWASQEMHYALDQFFHRLGQLAADFHMNDLMTAWTRITEEWGDPHLLQPHYDHFLEAFEARVLLHGIESPTQPDHPNDSTIQEAFEKAIDRILAQHYTPEVAGEEEAELNFREEATRYLEDRSENGSRAAEEAFTYLVDRFKELAVYGVAESTDWIVGIEGPAHWQIPIIDRKARAWAEPILREGLVLLQSNQETEDEEG